MRVGFTSDFRSVGSGAEDRDTVLIAGCYAYVFPLVDWLGGAE
jgi:hypothetical protein